MESIRLMEQYKIQLPNKKNDSYKNCLTYEKNDKQYTRDLSLSGSLPDSFSSSPQNDFLDILKNRIEKYIGEPTND
jgi:hypothetical protein